MGTTRWWMLLAAVLLLPFVYTPAEAQDSRGRTRLRLGYFPNVTHAQALIGYQRGDFAKGLGDDVQFEAVTFNAGPSVIEAIYAGHVDLAYIGPSPTLNGFLKSRGEEVRLISGAATGGVVIVGNAKRGIRTWEQLRGARISTPQLGNTQDVSAKYFLAEKFGYTIGNGATDTKVTPVSNPDTEILFEKDQLDAAWIPEPWGSRLMERGLVTMIAPETDLWPERTFALTGVIARRDFLEKNPEVVQRFLAIHIAITKELQEDSVRFVPMMNDEIERVTGKRLADSVLRNSMKYVGFDIRPLESSYEQFLLMGRKLGVLADDGQTIDRLFATQFLPEEARVSRVVSETERVGNQRRPGWWLLGVLGLTAAAGVIGVGSWRSRFEDNLTGGTPGWYRATIQVGFLVALVLIWEAVARMALVPAYLLPGPSDVVAATLKKVVDGTLFISVGASMGRMLVGYAISVVFGLVLGFLVAQSWLAKQTIGTLVLAFQSLPSVCWLPFALIWVGLNEQAIIVVIILGALFSIAVSTENAIRNIPPIYSRVGRTLGAKGWVLSRDIYFYAALPELIGGLKVGWTFAWRSLMAAELIRSDIFGIGHMLEVGRQFNDMGLMFGAILTILALGVTVDKLVFGRWEKSVRKRWGLEK